MENQKIQKTPTLEKVILDHAPADYTPKIINNPFKMENPSTGVSLYFADLLYQDLRVPCTLTNFANFDKEITEKLLSYIIIVSWSTPNISTIHLNDF